MEADRAITHDRGWSKWERGAYIALAAIVLGYVIARAVLVPFVNDEARTFFLYTQSGSFLPPDAKPDAANHLLVTAVAWPLYKAFGAAPWVLRGFSVVCFVLYAYYVMRAGAWVRSHVVRWCLWAALLGTPIILEFFSLYRGYGPSLAFLLMALVHLVGHARSGATGQLVASVAGIVLAVAASLTLLVPACAVMGMLLLGIPWARGRRAWVQLAVWSIPGLVPLALLSSHALELAGLGQLYYGSPDGLLGGTLASLTPYLFRCNGPLVKGVVLVVIGSAILTALWVLAREGWAQKRTPIALFLFLLLAEVTGRWILGGFAGVLYPVDRAAMHLVPIAVLLIACAIDRWAEHRRLFQWAAIGLLALPARSCVVANFDHTLLWPGQRVEEPLLRALCSVQERHGRPLVLGLDRFLKECVAYEAQWRGWKAPAVQQGIPQGLYDVWLMATDTVKGLPSHRTVMEYDGMAVLERSEPLPLVPVGDTLFVAEGRSFIGTWRTDGHTLAGGPVLLELEAVLRSAARPFVAYWVVEARDGDRTLFYDGLELTRIRGTWQGDTLRTARWIPQVQGDSTEVVAYFWDVEEAGLVLDRCRITIRRTEL